MDIIQNQRVGAVGHMFQVVYGDVFLSEQPGTILSSCEARVTGRKITSRMRTARRLVIRMQVCTTKTQID